MTGIFSKVSQIVLYEQCGEIENIFLHYTIVVVQASVSFFHSSSQQQSKNCNAFIYSVQLTIGNH
jgi:hypothetical protein